MNAPRSTLETGAIIDFARPEEASSIREFIHTFWKASHVLAESGTLLRWNHLDASRNRLNFVCAKVDGHIVAILGFIPTSHFDSAIPFAQDVWLALWKAREDIRRPGIGTALLRFLRAKLAPKTLCVVGINEEVSAIYRVFGFELFDLEHYYRVNRAKQHFELLAGKLERSDFEEFSNVSADKVNARLGDFRQVIEGHGYSPFKTVEYVRNRYVKHPFYRYDLTGVWRKGMPIALVVSRRALVGSAAAVRIVDLFGEDEDLACIGPAVEEIIHESDAEYADFYCYGYSHGSLEAAGLLLKSEDIVVPNYFEPFMRLNVPIHCAVLHTTKDPIRVVRADGDQDRPSLLPYSE